MTAVDAEYTEFDQHADLWPDGAGENFYPQLKLAHRVQIGGSCVSTSLSLLTGEAPAAIRQQINTQSPVSWSRYLHHYGMQFAYCAHDFRKLKYYVGDLLTLDDLFALSTYSPVNPLHIGSEPDNSGWVCGSHFVLLLRGMVHDTRFPEPVRLSGYCDLDRYVKRIFRIVPAAHDPSETASPMIRLL